MHYKGYSPYCIFLKLTLDVAILVRLVGGEEQKSGNVYAYNPTTGTYGPICGNKFDYNDVSYKEFYKVRH